MAASVILKNRTIAISRPRFERFRRNLAHRCTYHNLPWYWYCFRGRVRLGGKGRFWCAACNSVNRKCSMFTLLFCTGIFLLAISTCILLFKIPRKANSKRTLQCIGQSVGTEISLLLQRTSWPLTMCLSSPSGHRHLTDSSEFESSSLFWGHAVQLTLPTSDLNVCAGQPEHTR